MKTIIKLAVPLSCLLLLCSCGKDTATNPDTGNSSKSSSKSDSKKETINLNDYLEISFVGYDTVGYISMTGLCVNTERLLTDYPEAFGLSSPLEKNPESAAISYNIGNYMDCSVDESRNNHFSNGDSVAITWGEKYKELNNTYNVELIAEDTSVIVEGLAALQDIDPFEYANVFFTAGDSEDTLRCLCVKKDGAPLYIDFTPEKEIVTVGEKVKVDVVCTNFEGGTTVEEEYACYGYKPTQLEKEYVAAVSE